MARCLLGWHCHPACTYTSRPPDALGPGCLACNWVLVWMAQIEQAWSSSSPQLQNVYARCVQRWTGVAQPRQNSTDSLFHHFPEHHRHTSVPSTAQPEPLPHQPKHVRYYCTSLPERAHLVQVAAIFLLEYFLRLVLSVSVLCSLLLISLPRHWTW